MTPPPPRPPARRAAFSRAGLQRARRRLLAPPAPARAPDPPGRAAPSDPADLADAQMERSTRETLTASERSQLARVNRALSKLENGTYGLSDITGEPIPLARLLSSPGAPPTSWDAGDGSLGPRLRTRAWQHT